MKIKAKAWKWCFINCCCQMRLMNYKTLLSFQVSNTSTKSPPHPHFRFTWFLQSQARPPLMIYRVFTESSQALVYDLHGFYRVKPGPLLRFAWFLQSSKGPFYDLQGFYRVKPGTPFMIYMVFTVTRQAPFFDLESFYSDEPVWLFRFTGFLQGCGNI